MLFPGSVGGADHERVPLAAAAVGLADDGIDRYAGELDTFEPPAAVEVALAVAGYALAAREITPGIVAAGSVGATEEVAEGLMTALVPAAVVVFEALNARRDAVVTHRESAVAGLVFGARLATDPVAADFAAAAVGVVVAGRQWDEAQVGLVALDAVVGGSVARDVVRPDPFAAVVRAAETARGRQQDQRAQESRDE